MEQENSARLPVVVVGAGAAGMMAAIFAADGGRPALLLEGKSDGGRKILISGGGRCNVLPSEIDVSRYVTDSSPNVLRRLLRSWPLAEQRRFFEEQVGLRLVLEPETGKLFPESSKARQVRDALVALAERRGVRLRYSAKAVALQPLMAAAEADPAWRVVLESGEAIDAAAVVLATGGLSVPATGSDGTGLRIAAELGHTLHPTYPALTPLTAEPPPHAGLAGISLEVTAHAPAGRASWTTHGGFLFTHRGYSGPAALDISHMAVRSRLAGGARQPIQVQWTPLDAAAWDQALTGGGAGTVGPLLRRHLPARLTEVLLRECEIPSERRLSELPRAERARLVEALARYPLPWTGDEGYKKAEVTGGGVALSEVDPRTLESRRHPGLFLCGEILDAFGPIGGYNFYWAWATGRLAGLGVVGKFPTAP
jgi:predicted Rossmann fold flavoprotein